MQALVRHPHVAWPEAPLQFIELAEALPQLEVLTRGEFLQFRVVDPIRPDDETLDELDDDDDLLDDEDDFDYSGRRIADLSRPSVLLLRDGPERARLLRITPAQLRVAELVSQGWQASDADAGHEVPANNSLRAELTPQGDGLSLRLVVAPFGDFGPRLAPGQGRERVTTVHQGLTLSTQRNLATERAHQSTLLDKLDWLDETEHAWSLDQPDQALAAVEALAGLAPGIVSEWPKGKPLRVKTVTAAQVKLSVASKGWPPAKAATWRWATAASWP